MGLGTRVFIVHDDETLERLSVERFQRLLRRDPQARFVQHAGKRVRYALVVLDIVNRKPREIIRSEYGLLQFDSQGLIDFDERERAIELGLEMIPPIGMKPGAEQVVDARHQFAKKRYRDEFSWKPSREVEARIIKAIFGKKER